MLYEAIIKQIVAALGECSEKIELTETHDIDHSVVSIWRSDCTPPLRRDACLLLQACVEADSDFSSAKGVTLWVEHTPNGTWGDGSQFVYIATVDNPEFNIEPAIEIIREIMKDSLC